MSRVDFLAGLDPPTQAEADSVDHRVKKRRRIELQRIHDDRRHEKKHDEMFASEPYDYFMPPFPTISDLFCQCVVVCMDDCIEKRWAEEKLGLFRWWRRLRRARLRARKEKIARNAFLTKMAAAIKRRAEKKKMLKETKQEMLRILNGSATDEDYLTCL